MSTRASRVWFLVHKWTSLVCTAFLLMLCITGLPLIFHAEIDALGEHDNAYVQGGVASSSDDPGLQPLDAILAKALAARPGEVPLFMAFDNDRPLMTVTTGPSPDAPEDKMTVQLFDRSTSGSGAVKLRGCLVWNSATLAFMRPNFTLPLRYWASAFDQFVPQLLQGAPRTFKVSASVDF